MNTKAKASDLTQQDFGGDCDTPPEPWSAIWVAWNSEDGFTFWKHQNQAALWSAADSNEWPVQYAMQKAQPAPVPLTDEQKRELIKKSELWDMHIHMGWYSAPAKSFVEKTIQLIADIEAAYGITKGQP
jgi:hypothetical protein